MVWIHTLCSSSVISIFGLYLAQGKRAKEHGWLVTSWAAALSLSLHHLTSWVSRRVKKGLRYLASSHIKPFRSCLWKIWASYSSSVSSDKCSDSMVLPWRERQRKRGVSQINRKGEGGATTGFQRWNRWRRWWSQGGGVQIVHRTKRMGEKCTRGSKKRELHQRRQLKDLVAVTPGCNSKLWKTANVQILHTRVMQR